MFSEALAIMDHNTELYMIDEMRKESDELRKESDELRKELNQKDEELDQNRRELDQKDATIALAIRSLRNQGKSDEEIRRELGLEELPL